MKKFLLLAFLGSLPALASDFPSNGDIFAETLTEMRSDSGIKGPAYDVIVGDLDTLAEQNPDIAAVIRYGKSVEGRDLTIIRIARKDRQVEGAPAIYIGGSIHGNEYLNIEDRLPAWFVAEAKTQSAVSDYLAKGGVIYIAPILNPDGYMARQRANAHGVDLNRDFTLKIVNHKAFKEPEMKSLTDYLKSDLEESKKTLKLGLDYHCCIGALLYPWSFKGPILPQAPKVAHEEIAQILLGTLSPKFKIGTTPVVLGYDALGSSKDFYYEAFGALGFTLEGRYKEENKYFAEHTQMWTKIIEKFTP